MCPSERERASRHQKRSSDQVVSRAVTSSPDSAIVKAKVALKSMADGVITTDANGRVETLNRAAEALTGWSEAEARGGRLAEVFCVTDGQTGKPCGDILSHVLRDGRIAGLPEHTVLTDRGANQYAIEGSLAPIREGAGPICGVVLAFRNITERRSRDHQMMYQATHDSLTGLVNRGEFEKRLDRAIGAFHHHGTPGVLCYLDLDQFKMINDIAGHEAGDEMLRQIAALLKTRVRSRDTLARLGGDEFSLLLENCPAGKAGEIAEDLVAAVHDFRFTWDARRFVIGASVGVAPFTSDIRERAQLMNRADIACYTAKNMGRNRVCFYEPGSSGAFWRNQRIWSAEELHDALESGRFRLYLEPIRPAGETGCKIHSYEVAIRLPYADGKLLSPASWMPAAERSGFMAELDRWAIRETLNRFGSFLTSREDPGIAINLSARSLDDHRLIRFVQESLAESGVQAERVCFELTETAVINRLDAARHLMKQLRKLGCRVALDNTGSGFFSFRYLKYLSIDYLKIDGNLVRDARHDDIDRAMIRAINEIGHTMGIATIAESVETEQCLSMVRQTGIDFVQGSAIGIPRPLEDLRMGQMHQDCDRHC